MIPLSGPDVTEAEIEAVAEVLRGPQLSLGGKLIEFEDVFSRHAGVEQAVAVSSGTAGLHLAMIALGIKAGDEVIVPSFTFIAAANAIRYVRATPVFVDIDAESLNLSPDAVERAITARTRAVVAVHTFGRPAEMLRLEAVAEAHGLALVEDACEALGAEIGGRRVGSFGHVAVFGFYPNKQITTGEGGMVVTANPALAGRMRRLRNQGREATGKWLQHAEVGYNYRLSELACALGIGQMGRIEEILTRREEVARTYDTLLTGRRGLVLPTVDVEGVRLSWFVYVVRLDDSYTIEDRDRVVDAMQHAGVQCGRYFAPIHLQAAYKAWNGLRLPMTEACASRTIALPFFNRISDAEIVAVSDALLRAMDGLNGSGKN